MGFISPDYTGWSSEELRATLGFIQREIIRRQQKDTLPLLDPYEFRRLHAFPECRLEQVPTGTGTSGGTDLDGFETTIPFYTLNCKTCRVRSARY